MEVEKMVVPGSELPRPEQPSLTLEALDNEPGFYQYVIRPMLYPGHEGELCTWLKEMGLIQRSVRCINGLKNPTCNSPMKWTQARIVDKYQWKCSECLRKRPIRDDSFFKQTKCSLTTTLRIILGWCKDYECEDLVSALSVKSYVIKKVYEACSQIAEGYVKSHSGDWRLGGPGTVVLVDVYPDGCAKAGTRPAAHHNNNRTPVLCLAEVGAVPTNYWFSVVDAPDRGQAAQLALKVVQRMVRPGSTLVADAAARVCSSADLAPLREYAVVDVAELARHDRPGRTLLASLETIWAPALAICEDAQCLPPHLVQFYLYKQLWRRRFARTPSAALESLLHHIADHFPEIDFV